MEDEEARHLAEAIKKNCSGGKKSREEIILDILDRPHRFPELDTDYQYRWNLPLQYSHMRLTNPELFSHFFDLRWSLFREQVSVYLGICSIAFWMFISYLWFVDGAGDKIGLFSSVFVPVLWYLHSFMLLGFGIIPLDRLSRKQAKEQKILKELIPRR